MPVEKGSKRTYFPRVTEARNFLRDKAKDLLELQIKLIMEAAASGEYESATKANQWLIEHLPAGDDGVRVIDTSASKPKEIAQGTVGPTVNIGIAFGGIQASEAPKQVTGEVIDIAAIPVKDGKTH